MKGDRKKLEFLWENISNIYLNKGSNYKCSFEDLYIESDDNYYYCEIYNPPLGDKILEFKIFIEHSLTSEVELYFEEYSDESLDHYIEKLKPIFRDYKISEIVF